MDLIVSVLEIMDSIPFIKKHLKTKRRFKNKSDLFLNAVSLLILLIFIYIIFVIMAYIFYFLAL